MDPASAVFGIVTGVGELYRVVKATYDLYLDVRDFPSSYQELYFCFQIERQRVELWGIHVLSDQQRSELEASHNPSDVNLWKLFQTILHQILSAFHEAGARLGSYRELADESLSQLVDDFGLVDSASAAKKSSRLSRLENLARGAKFVLRDQEKLKALAQKLCYWNDSLEKMTQRWDQESLRRRLRSYLSTSNTGVFRQLELAASLLQHRDIESLASARELVEQIHRTEKNINNVQSTEILPSEYNLRFDDFNWHNEPPFRTEGTRATAIYKGETVLVDWRTCRDDTWRKQHRGEFYMRTENLARLLNCDLQPLNLGILQCLGYLNRSSNVSGYAFRPPSDSRPGQRPKSLSDILRAIKDPDDIPDLGERFALAKALVSTIFEIHNFGWMHKNIQPKNILFWPKSGTDEEPNISKPYLVGFDISRLNQPGEMSEKPIIGTEDDVYRHPEYQRDDPRPFVPSFDMYSVGVVLFEIGMWRSVTSRRHRKPQSSSKQAQHTSDPTNDRFIDEVVMGEWITGLKRYTGTRYLEAVKKCLNKELDTIWEDEDADSEEQLAIYLEAVQNEVLDRVAICNA